MHPQGRTCSRADEIKEIPTRTTLPLPRSLVILPPPPFVTLPPPSVTRAATAATASTPLVPIAKQALGTIGVVRAHSRSTTPVAVNSTSPAHLHVRTPHGVYA